LHMIDVYLLWNINNFTISIMSHQAGVCCRWVIILDIFKPNNLFNGVWIYW